MGKLCACLLTLLGFHSLFGDVVFVREWGGRVYDSEGNTRGWVHWLRTTEHGEYILSLADLPVWDNVDNDPQTGYKRIRASNLDGQGNCQGKIYHEAFPMWKAISFRLIEGTDTAEITFDYDDLVLTDGVFVPVRQHLTGILNRRW